MTRLQNYVIATRPWSFSMSLISVSLGTLLAAEQGSIHWGWYLAVAVGVVLCHAGGNVLNDYFDTKSGVDQPDSGTVKYRPHPVLAGLMSQGAVLVEALTLLGLAAVIGMALALFRSMLIFWIALTGLLLTVFYTGRPINLKYRALGELVVFLIWGPLMFQGAYVAQAGVLSVKALVASVPFGVLVALVLFANNMRDIEQDGRTGIRTLATLLGRHGSLIAYAGFIACAFAYTLVAVGVGAMSPWVLLVFFSLPTAIGLVRRFNVSVPEAADALTAKLDTVFGLLFLAGLLIDRVVKL